MRVPFSAAWISLLSLEHIFTLINRSLNRFMLIVTSTTSLFPRGGTKVHSVTVHEAKLQNVRFFAHLNHHQLLRELFYAAVNNCLLISNTHPASDPSLAGFVPHQCPYHIRICYRSPMPLIDRSVHTRSFMSVRLLSVPHLALSTPDSPVPTRIPPLSLPDPHHSSARPLHEPGINFSMSLLTKAASMKSSFNLSTADNATGSNFCPHRP